MKVLITFLKLSILDSSKDLFCKIEAKFLIYVWKRGISVSLRIQINRPGCSNSVYIYFLFMYHFSKTFTNFICLLTCFWPSLIKRLSESSMKTAALWIEKLLPSLFLGVFICGLFYGEYWRWIRNKGGLSAWKTGMYLRCEQWKQVFLLWGPWQLWRIKHTRVQRPT